MAGIVVLAISFSTNPSEQQVRRASVSTRVSSLAGLLAVLLALFSPGDPFAFMFFLPGLVLSYASFLDRRIVARDIGLRKLRGVPVGLFGNLGGMMAEMNDYGIEPSTRFEWKKVAAGILLFMGLMIEAILRADARSHFVGTATGFRQLLIFVGVSGIIGFIVGVWLRM
ncbi:MAG TPA: hypothetical protein VFE98_04295 [Candidatus Bathyarchaeia archaeon]|nr:hypothetical protein [Candidatus Bathyarchaeia archaeon]